jgi:hypothetical protein
MKKKTVICKICCKAFERFATQPEGKHGWRCSSECIQEDAKRRNAKVCVECNRRCITTRAKVCIDCKTRAESVACEFCGATCQKTKNKHQFCDRNCRRKFLRRTSVTVGECKWCGKEYHRWMYATGERGGGQFCSMHCKHSSKRLKQYVRQKSRQAATFAAYRKIHEHWIACRLNVLEKEHAEKTEEQQWAEKIKSLCAINRHREKQTTGTDRSKTTKHERNRQSDWKHGGAWNRIVFFELQTLKAKANLTEEELWFMRVFNQLCSQRKRMQRKQAAGCRHGG